MGCISFFLFTFVERTFLEYIIRCHYEYHFILWVVS